MQRNRDHRFATAGSLVLEKPIPSNNTNSRTGGGNLQLMEARLIELQSSLRALYRSNEELQEFLNNQRGGEEEEDQDFVDAMEENWVAMRNQRCLAIELVSEMKQRGVNIDLPKDICDMKIPDGKKNKKATATTTTAQESQTTESSSSINNAANSNTETGIYL